MGADVAVSPSEKVIDLFNGNVATTHPVCPIDGTQLWKSAFSRGRGDVPTGLKLQRLCFIKSLLAS